MQIMMLEIKFREEEKAVPAESAELITKDQEESK